MKVILFALCLSLALISGPVSAKHQPERPHPLELFLDSETREEIERLMRNGAVEFLEAMHRFMRAIPRYEMPEITPEGDIIIRRHRPNSDDVHDLSLNSETSI